MILPVLAALLTAIGPLLRGSWDLWAQSILELSLIGGFSIWLISRILVGYLPVPSRQILLWTGALVLLGCLSVYNSPIRGLVRADWQVFLCALWLFPAMTVLSKDQRWTIDEAIRVSAWILMVLAFYQRFALHDSRPASVFPNENIYAGAVLMFLALAVEKKDWLLTIGLLISLMWTRSVGAWLGLSMALVWTQRRSSSFWFWTGTALMAFCAVLIYGKLESPEVLHRWWWWRAAARMAIDRPWTGYGPGAFAYVLPRYVDRSAGLFSVYAHEYPLEVFSGYGLAFGICWFGGLWKCLYRARSHKAFGAIAILVQSLWDYPLAIPSNLWLMCYFAGSSIAEGTEGLNVPSRQKLPALLLSGGVALALATGVLSLWDAQKMAVKSAEALQGGRLEEARRWVSLAREETPENPELFTEAASIAMASGDWLQAAAELDRAACLNPYRPATWTELALAYKRLGRLQTAESVRRQSLSFITPG